MGQYDHLAICGGSNKEQGSRGPIEQWHAKQKRARNGHLVWNIGRKRPWILPKMAEDPAVKWKRGLYKRYLQWDPEDMPPTTKWRLRQSNKRVSSFSLIFAIQIYFQSTHFACAEVFFFLHKYAVKVSHKLRGWTQENRWGKLTLIVRVTTAVLFLPTLEDSY